MSNTYVVYKNMNFDKPGNFFKAILNANSEGGSINIVLDSLSGSIAGTLDILPTGDTFKEQTCLLNGITGVHDIYLVFNGGLSSVCKLKSFLFEVNSDN